MQIDPISTGIRGIAIESKSGEVKNHSNTSYPGSYAHEGAVSTDLRTVNMLVARAMQSSPARQVKLNALQAEVTRGSYSVNPQEIAAAMLMAG